MQHETIASIQDTWSPASTTKEFPLIALDQLLNMPIVYSNTAHILSRLLSPFRRSMEPISPLCDRGGGEWPYSRLWSSAIRARLKPHALPQTPTQPPLPRLSWFPASATSNVNPSSQCNEKIFRRRWQRIVSGKHCGYGGTLTQETKSTSAW